MSLLLELIFAALALDHENPIQGGGGDPQPLRNGDVVLHVLVHGASADHQHMRTPEEVTGHVDAVFMLLGNFIVQEQGQEQKRADRRKASVIDRAAIPGGGFSVFKLVIAPEGGDVR